MKKTEQPLSVAKRHRLEARCPYFGKCGGCSWQDIAHEFQPKIKREFVQDAFDEAKIACHIAPVEPCPEPFYYRNRMDYVFGKNGELGLKVSGHWWETLDLKTCFLLSSETPEILERTRVWTKETGLPFWNVKTHQGFFRYLVIREGKNTDERLIMLVVSNQFTLPTEHRSAILHLFAPLATSLLVGVNETITDLSIPQRIETLFGEPYLHEVVNGLRYRITPASFFQTNTAMAVELQHTVCELAGNLKNKKVLDLYCGAGFFSLALAKEAKEVIGIELDEDAIKGARLNASLNQISNASFFASKVEEFDWALERPDVVILDPPRAGLHPSVIETLLAVLPKRIVYVSCKYQKLVEELPRFLEYYAIEEVRALDLFPQTPHVEVVVSLISKPL
ncbi:MAG: 23S rRNA (uracil(1939)-C(5))-methyltransferase RlmD [Patescibacteria group bacterium]